MPRIIPNEQTYIGWSETAPSDMQAPTVATDLTNFVDWTCFVSSITASTQGNTIPVPDLCTKFEKTIGGTVNAQFTAEFYRDDTDDTAWTTLTRGKKGYFLISRFKDVTSAAPTDPVPAVGDPVEVWPVEVTSRQAGPLSSNTVQTFSVQFAVNIEPAEDATMA